MKSYEHLVFDGQCHDSAPSFPLNPCLRNAVWPVGSFGKTFHVTGWKTGLLRGYTCADATVPVGLSVCQLLRSYPSTTGFSQLYAATS